jgi:hypothetical protein
MNPSHKAKEIAYIAIGVATLIGGGFFILQLSLIFPIPGVKYIMMAPFMSMVIYILLMKIATKHALIKIGTVFGLIMTIFNVFMGIAILVTAILTQLSILPAKSFYLKAFIGASLFSGYTGFFALATSKYLIGGIFDEIPLYWIAITSLASLAFGVIGTLFASKLYKYINHD